MSECESCALLKNCHLQELVVNDTLNPVIALEFKDVLLSASRTNISSRRVLDDRGIPRRIASLEFFGKRNEDGIVTDPTKAVINCEPIHTQSAWANIPLLNLFVNKRETAEDRVRKVGWSKKTEAMKDYLSALNDYISVSWFYHLSNIDNGQANFLDNEYIQKNASLFVDDINSELTLDRKLYKLGYHQGSAMVISFRKTLNKLANKQEVWHASDFIDDKMIRIDDAIREGICRTKLNGNTSLEKITDLVSVGSETQSIVSGPLVHLYEIYSFLDSHVIADLLTKTAASNLPLMLSNLGFDMPGCPHRVLSKRAIPEMPALTNTSPGISSREIAPYRKGSFICPANHDRSTGATNFLAGVFDKYYKDPDKYKLSYEFLNNDRTVVNDYSHKAMESRALFINTLLNVYPKFYMDWVDIADQLKRNNER
jgi:hypothetical protein